MDATINDHTDFCFVWILSNTVQGRHSALLLDLPSHAPPLHFSIPANLSFKKQNSG